MTPREDFPCDNLAPGVTQDDLEPELLDEEPCDSCEQDDYDIEGDR